MKENIATIPLIDAFKADGECPFCHLEREAEQHAISFILGSAYMEDDIREKTDATGSVSYTHLTLPTIPFECRSRWSPYH